VDAGAVSGLSQFALDVMDGEIACAHGHHQGADAITYGRGGRALGEGGEEAGAEVQVVTELVIQDAERTGGIAETLINLSVIGLKIDHPKKLNSMLK